jgi:putative spermidine/putrescine transport system substrate-binding protein
MMLQVKPTRRQMIGGVIGAAGLAVAPRARADVKPPSSPLTVNVVDVAGNLALTRPAFELYAKQNPKLVRRFAFSQAPAPELPGKIKAQESANRIDIDLVLTGTDALSAGIDQGLWEPMFPQHAAQLPDLQKILLPNAWRMQSLAQNQAVIVSYYPSGPLLEYLPSHVPQVPTTPDELLTWAKANPNKFMYARPANSGPGRTFLMGLPYLLGDKDPKDPQNGWDKTWAYLEELGKQIEYYPSGTGALMREFGQESRWLMPTTTGWDINPRVLGTVPKSAEVAAFKNFRWVMDAHYIAVPKGIANERLNVLLDLISFLLTKPAQAFAYDKGYFYPGPAVAGVTLDMAPQDSQDAIKEFGRPIYEKLIADTPTELPLEAQKLVLAFQLWDQRVGANKGH